MGRTGGEVAARVCENPASYKSARSRGAHHRTGKFPSVDLVPLQNRPRAQFIEYRHPVALAANEASTAEMEIKGVETTHPRIAGFIQHHPRTCTGSHITRNRSLIAPYFRE